jgi:nitroimidazol reductase NimA-like FMN-containing flavoprotein (pyridoxamine 5'-phosphate oxidase superfamily)
VTAELTPEGRAFIDAARVARLATLMPDGGIHVVPICPALDRDRILFSTEPNRKVEHLRVNPTVGLAFDEYDEDWSRLRGLSISGTATIHAEGPVWDRCRDLLYEKFPQYEPDAEIVPGRTLAIAIDPTWVSRGGL